MTEPTLWLVIYKLFECSPNIPSVFSHTGKPIESVVYCFYKITLKHVSVFFEFTGTINLRFLTSQNARTILVILYYKQPCFRKKLLYY